MTLCALIVGFVGLGQKLLIEKQSIAHISPIPVKNTPLIRNLYSIRGGILKTGGILIIFFGAFGAES